MAPPQGQLAAFEAYLRSQGVSIGSLAVQDVGEDGIKPFEHYPAGDVFDPNSQCQFYFHRHQGAEFGHFHLFLRPLAVVRVLGEEDEIGPNPTHLIAVQLNKDGFASSLFTTNQWVTGESYYPSRIMAQALEHFSIILPGTAGIVGHWLTLLVQEMAPRIIRLLEQRDKILAISMASGRSLEQSLQEQSLEVMSSMELAPVIADETRLI